MVKAVDKRLREVFTKLRFEINEDKEPNRRPEKGKELTFIASRNYSLRFTLTFVTRIF